VVECFGHSPITAFLPKKDHEKLQFQSKSGNGEGAEVSHFASVSHPLTYYKNATTPGYIMLVLNALCDLWTAEPTPRSALLPLAGKRI